MFEFDLIKHKPKVKVENSYLCNVRKRLISKTPEEEVRQSLVNYLIKDKGYPIENIRIEVPMAHFQKGAKGRADILILDNDDNILCLIECKEFNEVLTDSVFDQIIRYNEIVDAETLCIVIGKTIYFYAYIDNDDEPKILTDFPTFKTLIESGQVDYFLPDKIAFEKYDFKEPFEDGILNMFYEDGVFGIDTDEKYLPFLFNLYNFYIDEQDRLIDLSGIEDIGIKITKYGNSGGGRFFGNYRAFIDYNSNSIVSFSISSMTRGAGYPVHTSLMFAVDVKGYFHLSLELRVDKYVSIIGDKANVWHDGTITVGKIGSAKRIELIDFIKTHKPSLIREDKVFLGEFDFTKEIHAKDESTQLFISNCIEYAIVRDRFREHKKNSINII